MIQDDNIEKPISAQDFTLLACMAMQQGMVHQAVALCREALKLEPNRADTLSTLGGLLGSPGIAKYGEAERCLIRAIEIQPDVIGGWFNKGVIYEKTGFFYASKACFEIALGQGTDPAIVYMAMGTLMQYTQEWGKQAEYYVKALSHDPDRKAARMCLGISQLLTGDWKHGLENYESRIGVAFSGWPLPVGKVPVMPLDFMGDSEIRPGNILVVGEQGDGDMIMFSRYGKILKNLYPCNTFHLFCREEMLPFMRLVPGWSSACSPSTIGSCGFVGQIAMMSIPRLLDLKHRRRGPSLYLHYSPVRPSVNRREPDPAMPLQVGVCWKGNPHHPNDRYRSIPMDELVEPLRKINGCWIWSLQQYGQDNLKINNLFDGGNGWVETAHDIQEMDLVITVDTAIAHLAGTLGIETWLLLAANPDWRWGLEGTKTPWYPSVTLFRQKTLGEWGPVVEEVRSRLEG